MGVITVVPDEHVDKAAQILQMNFSQTPES